MTSTPTIEADVPVQALVQRLEFAIPDGEAPGFLRRQRDAAKHLDALKRTASLAALDEMISFLLQFVETPHDREIARELLLDLSRDDYNKLLAAILRENEDFLP